ncbi:MAG: hypothetical protein QNK23_09880 [Crocinitomicaceae bacterium]|nr:hypothetical protein [Crocinitomicaceae bacterium]
MNLRNFTKEHVKGMLLGIITPLIFVPIVVFILSLVEDEYFKWLWAKFLTIDAYQVKVITLAIIANLGWFYLFLNKERYNIAMGVILGSVAYAPYIIYVKFF